MEKKIFIKTFGCQMNEYDSNRIYDSVKKIGFKKTNDQKNADCFVLNTCHIRDKAKEKVYHEIGRVKKIYRKKNKPIVVVAGCVAQAENQEMLKREPYIDIVIGPQSYHSINKVIKDLEKKSEVLTKQWSSEKDKLNESQKLTEALDTARITLERAEREGNWTKAGELKYSVIPQLEEKLQDAAKVKEQHIINEEVTDDDIASIISRWTGIPVDKMLEGEREKLLGMESNLQRRVVGHQERARA
mgnify:CR=1 FL=1